MSPDISMCKNKKCERRKKCYRFMAKPNEYRQAYGDFRCNERLDEDAFMRIEK
jgi:hypothetical protein